LSSFDAIEEPLVKYFPATGKFVPDDFRNITDEGGGTFRMFERFNQEWWDGDRDTENKDRQRAEVKGLGPHQHHGERFEYASTWRLNPDFHGTSGFCHLFQLKALNGDSGAPLVTLSIHGDEASVEANPGGPHIVARVFRWKPGVWQTVVIRIKTSAESDGEIGVSVDGDPFQGKTGIALSRPGSDAYRPKWGLYRRAATHQGMGTDFVEHRNVSARKLGVEPIANERIETEARMLAASHSPEEALGRLQARPASAARDFAIASIAALWAETNPSAAMEWAERLPRGALRADATARIFSRWSDQDVAAAKTWLVAHAPDSDLDPIVWLFTTDTTYRYVNRPVALESLSLIKDPDLRLKAFEHVLEIWARTEKKAAIGFANASPLLTPEQKNELVRRLGGAK
jgi:hypothetical protein